MLSYHSFPRFTLLRGQACHRTYDGACDKRTERSLAQTKYDVDLLLYCSGTYQLNRSVYSQRRPLDKIQSFRKPDSYFWVCICADAHTGEIHRGRRRSRE